jgi:hypothetical protein
MTCGISGNVDEEDVDEEEEEQDEHEDEEEYDVIIEEGDDDTNLWIYQRFIKETQGDVPQTF